MDSILLSIKKLLGIDSSYTIFDGDIILHINTAFTILNQIGIGPEEGYMIDSEHQYWDEYTDDINLNMVKSFIFLNVKINFDPPSSTALLDSMNRTINELTWRLELQGQSKNK